MNEISLPLLGRPRLSFKAEMLEVKKSPVALGDRASHSFKFEG